MWDEAAGDFSEAMQLEAPIDSRQWEGAAAIFYLTDREDDYRAMYSRFMTPLVDDSPALSINSIRSCLIAPTGSADAQRLLLDAEKLLDRPAGPPGPPGDFWGWRIWIRRGASSYGHVSRGSKRSFNISLDMADEDQRIDGYKTLNLLNCHGDPSMMSSVVYSHIARQHIAAPRANFVHKVVNGESWGLYDSVQQFDKQFLAENFGGSKGTRWKVSSSPHGDGGLRYLGDDLEEYKSRFEMKSNDGKKAWNALIQLCKTLNETPLDQLELALDPILDIDGALRFLALDVVLVNSDGYWTRASDYNLFRDKDGKFHLIPHDMNEAFALANRGGGPGRGGPGGDRRGGFGGFGFGPPPREGGQFNQRDEGGPRDSGPRGRRGPGPGGPGRGGPGRGGVDLDPLVGLDNDRMPLRSRLLAIPKLRERYLQYVDRIVEDSLAWEKLGPVVDNYRDLVDSLVKADTRKLSTYEAFVAVTRSDTDKADEQMSLRKFAIERSKHLRSQR